MSAGKTCCGAATGSLFTCFHEPCRQAGFLLFTRSAATAAKTRWSCIWLPSAKQARESGAGIDGLLNPSSEQEGMICQYMTFRWNWIVSRKNP